MNKKEIEKAKQCLNEIIQNSYAERKAIKLDNLRKYIQELEQKQFILDKVTDKLKEYLKAIKRDGIYGYDKEINEILNIIEGEKNNGEIIRSL